MSLSHLATLCDRCKSPIDKETSRRMVAFFLPTLQRCGVGTGKFRQNCDDLPNQNTVSSLIIV